MPSPPNLRTKLRVTPMARRGLRGQVRDENAIGRSLQIVSMQVTMHRS